MNDIRPHPRATTPTPPKPVPPISEPATAVPAKKKAVKKRPPLDNAAAASLLLIAGSGLLSGLAMIDPAGLLAWFWLPLLTIPLGYAASRFTPLPQSAYRAVLLALVVINAVLLFRVEPLLAALLFPLSPLLAFRPHTRGSWITLTLALVAGLALANAAALVPLSLGSLQPVPAASSLMTAGLLLLLLLLPATRPGIGLRALGLWHVLAISAAASVIFAKPATSWLEPLAAGTAPVIELLLGIVATGAALLLLRKTW